MVGGSRDQGSDMILSRTGSNSRALRHLAYEKLALRTTTALQQCGRYLGIDAILCAPREVEALMIAESMFIAPSNQIGVPSVGSARMPRAKGIPLCSRRMEPLLAASRPGLINLSRNRKPSLLGGELAAKVPGFLIDTASTRSNDAVSHETRSYNSGNS